MSQVYLTKDHDAGGFTDVWLDKPPTKKLTLDGYVWGMWYTDWDEYVGVFKDDIVRRVFGAVPCSDAEMMQIEVDPQLLTGLSNN